MKKVDYLLMVKEGGKIDICDYMFGYFGYGLSEAKYFSIPLNERINIKHNDFKDGVYFK